MRICLYPGGPRAVELVQRGGWSAVIAAVRALSEPQWRGSQTCPQQVSASMFVCMFSWEAMLTSVSIVSCDGHRSRFILFFISLTIYVWSLLVLSSCPHACRGCSREATSSARCFQVAAVPPLSVKRMQQPRGAEGRDNRGEGVTFFMMEEVVVFLRVFKCMWCERQTSAQKWLPTLCGVRVGL